MSVEAPFRTQVTVAGMTCQHCVLSVVEELTALDGVSGVEASLEDGAVTVVADRAVGRGEIAAAIDEVGYSLVG